ncbi:Por secretion system C-terminal sorting domain-containing protein [Chryseobacterium oleae]|uniref:Por secretion system C-terminal sorting domain-containing protein n=1 Tax=Chryseobacterium oleae TaxID=491207 RepID=A0A1I4YIE8_CHROL|nr:PKD domain-containing protein [Chryseobacterium oleae]SFN37603.1 Por secretion system C-terminal sorting domain-containing protein [Chryseobacterium oleae]
MNTMIKSILILVLLNISTLLFAQADQVLFIGNSMTYFNDMPVLFKDLAASKGKNIEVTSHTVGGVGFANHVNDNTLYQTIRSKNYKYVVMQPGTGESGGHSVPVALTAERGRKLRDSIRKYSPCSKIFLYEISNGIGSQNGYPAYFATQKIIKDSITKMSTLMQTEMIPAGESARAHYTATQDLALHSSYGDVHPNPQGSYLVAATVYAALFQDRIFPSSFLSGMTQDKAEYYQQLADGTFFNNPAQWNANVFHLHAGFSASGNGQNINFSNLSTNYDTVLWTFGDGTTSTVINPVHLYAASGTYTVSLKVTKNSCSETFTKTINTSQLSVSDYAVKKFQFYPNPVSDTGFLKTEKFIKEIEIYSIDGRKIKTLPYSNVNDVKIDFSAYSKGIYILTILFEDGNSERLKIIKE